MIEPQPIGTAAMRWRALLACVLVMLAIAAAGLRPAGGQEQDARPILENAATAMGDVASFHFKLETEGGTTTLMEGFELASLEGDVVRPDRFQAKGTVKVAFVTLDVEVIGIADQLWVTDPMSRDGDFIEISTGEGGPMDDAGLNDLLNPDRLLLRAVALIQNPVVAGEEEIDGAKTTRIDGTFDPTEIELGTPTAQLLTLQPMPVQLWIDEAGRVRRLRLDGPLTDAEDPKIVRRLELTKFDEEIEINSPSKG